MIFNIQTASPRFILVVVISLLDPAMPLLSSPD